MKTYAIIPAGGVGRRFGSSIPKQYVKVKGKEIIAYTLEAFQKSELIEGIVIAAEESFFELLEEVKEEYGFTKIKKVVKGGNTRQDSVYNALSSLENCEREDLIAVHDAARPMLSVELLENAILFAQEKGNAVVASKVHDTVFEGGERVEKFLDREKIYTVQTPQIFSYGILKEAMEKARAENFYGTDESSLVFRVSEAVNIFPNDSWNIKITSKFDLALFEFFLNFKNK